MILPIYVYGQPVLRKEAEDITPDYPNLKELIANMFETMNRADGVGLAAPQIGLPIRVVTIQGFPPCLYKSSYFRSGWRGSQHGRRLFEFARYP